MLAQFCMFNVFRRVELSLLDEWLLRFRAGLFCSFNYWNIIHLRCLFVDSRFNIFILVRMCWFDTFVIPTILALALPGTRNTSLEAFAILLLALWVFTITSFKMFSFILIHLIFKCLKVPFENFNNGCKALSFMILIIETFSMLMALAIRSTSSIVP